MLDITKKKKKSVKSLLFSPGFQVNIYLFEKKFDFLPDEYKRFFKVVFFVVETTFFKK